MSLHFGASLEIDKYLLWMNIEDILVDIRTWYLIVELIYVA